MIKSILEISDFCKKSCNSIMVLGRGPSLNFYNDELSVFKENNEVTVLGSNMADGKFHIDFNVMVDNDNYKKIRHKDLYKSFIVGPKIVVGSDDFKTKEFFLLDYNPKKNDNNSIEIDDSGKIGHFVGNCGNATLLSAIIMGAKNIFICGIDGIKYDENGYGYINHYYRDKHVRYVPEIRERRSTELLKMILDYCVNQRNISVYCKKECYLWGFDKKSMGIKEF